MRNLIKTMSIWAALGSTLALTGCGGIDGSGERPPIQVSASGPINGFGSVIVNGVRYDTDHASIYVRGRIGEEMELDVGDYVVVVGEVFTNDEGILEGVANEVHYQPRVTGLVEAIDINFNRLTIMGQTVQLMEDTTYSSDIMPRNIEGFSVGNKVTVSGVSDADGIVRATRIETSETPLFEVLGAIELVDKQLDIFHIDGVKIDYSGIPGIEDNIVEGRIAVVSGDGIEGDTLFATRASFNLDYRKLRQVESVEVTGFVSGLSSTGFEMDTLPIRFTDSTRIEGGSLNDLSNNDKVRVEGAIGSDDNLHANVVEIIPSPDMQVYGTLQSIVPSSWGSQYLGTVQVQDHIFWVQFDTRLVGENEERISFYDLRVGDSVYVSGYRGENRNLFATSLAVDNRQFENLTYDIQGFIYAPIPEQHSFFMFNTRIITSDETVFTNGFTDFTEEQFYSNAANHYVLVRGYFDFTQWSMVATRITFIYPWAPLLPPPM